MLCEGPYDEDIETILREQEADRRAKLTHALGQKLYNDYRSVMLGVKATAWAVTKKVSGWDTLVSVPLARTTTNTYADRQPGRPYLTLLRSPKENR